MSAHRAVVHVVDDDVAVRDGLRRMFASVGLRTRLYSRVDAFLAAYRPGSPGCLVLDVRLPGMSGIEFLERLGELEVRLPVVVLTGHGDVPMAVRALQRGAADFIEKTANPQRLLDAVQRALAGAAPRAQPHAGAASAGDSGAVLSARERQVAGRVAHGMTSKAIAGELGIGVRTVETHRASAMHKLGAANAADLVRLLGGPAPPPGD